MTEPRILAQSFIRTIDLTDEIRRILNDYPLGSGILRELIQNTDDAGADTQVLVLDTRSFSTETILDPALARYQGPSLLAYNNAQFTERDWNSLKSISNSGKKADFSKTGKFGLGFNAVHHITDTPMIISGNRLAILDPHDEMHQYPGGATIDYPMHAEQLQDQLSAFNSLLTEPTSPSKGTIIRLPLRTNNDASRSRIKKVETSVADIRHLMLSFIEDELDIALLFLKHLKRIELREILQTGGTKVLGCAELLDVPGLRPALGANHFTTTRLSMLITHHELITHHDWLVRHEAGDLTSLSSQFGSMSMEKVNVLLQEEKLFSKVALALPLSSNSITGRLFAHLPLPIKTNFPVHIHALFALTSDRQSLRNSNEITEPESRENMLQKWNAYLFQELIPCTWANLLEDAKLLVGNIHAFWPISQSSGLGDWGSVCMKTLMHVSEKRLCIFPLHTPYMPSPNQFSSLDEALVDLFNTTPEVLAAITRTGVSVIKPPNDLIQLFASSEILVQDMLVTPETVSRELQNGPINHVIETLSAKEKVSILYYLYNPKASDQLLGIPIIPLVLTDSFAALYKASTPGLSNSSQILFASIAETNLFGDLEPCLVNQAILQELGPTNPVKVLDFPQTFLDQTNAAHFDLAHGCNLTKMAVNTQSFTGQLVEWLVKVHKWADSLYKQYGVLRASKHIDKLPLPLTNSTFWFHSTQPSPSIITSQDLGDEQVSQLQILDQLGIPLLHRDFPATMYLQDMGRITSIHDAEALLQWVGIQATNVMEAPPSLHAILHQLISQALYFTGPLTQDTSQALCNTPVFLAYQPGLLDNPINTSQIYTVFGEQQVYIMDPPPSILPLLPNCTLLVYHHSSNTQLIKALDPNARCHTELQLAQLAAENLLHQPVSLIDQVFTMLILPNIRKLSKHYPKTYCGLQGTAFVTTAVGRQSPSSLIDPRAQIHYLFEENEGEIPTGVYATDEVLEQLPREFFRANISPEIVDNRVRYYASNNQSFSAIQCAEKLLNILDNVQLCGAKFMFPSSIRQQTWIPIGGRMVDASNSRDESQSIFVSRVLSVLPRTLKNPCLRAALGWSDIPPSAILHQQFLALLQESPPISDTVITMQGLLPSIAVRLTMDELSSLRIVIGDRGWIPVGNQLQPSQVVYISQDIYGLEPAFFRLPEELSSNNNSSCLMQMGIPYVPHPKNLICALEALARSPKPPLAYLDHAIQLVEALCKTELPKDLRDVMVPTLSGELRYTSEVVFDDRHSLSGDAVEPHAFAHARVSPHVATVLHLRKASSCLADAIIEEDAFSDYEQKETMQNKIAQTLLGYTYFSTCNEVLANAEDAGATEASILYDECEFTATGSLYPLLQEIHRGPALVIHNNAVFSDKDWEGLSQVGVGGKTDINSIGRFGLGALTFYHWTDVPTIVSGDYILLLDPAGEYLSENRNGQPRRGSKINLRTCTQPELAVLEGMLKPIIGLFGFDYREYYHGTIIRLPFRHSKSKLLDATYENPNITNFLTQCQCDVDMAFLFTNSLQHITVSHRERNFRLSNIVDTRGVHDEVPQSHVPDYPNALGVITASEVTVTRMTLDQATSNRTDLDSQRYLVVRSTIDLNSLASEGQSIRQCAQRHRLSTPSIGLACPTGTRPRSDTTMRLMSPFAIGVTQLPVHLHGEFILSSDRTSIFMDRFSVETQYNEFLLGRLAPPAYLYLIHLLLQQGHPTRGLWPPRDYSVTEILTTKTYKLLEEFPGVLFETMATDAYPTRLISPKEAVFSVASTSVLIPFLHLLDVPDLVTKHSLDSKLSGDHDQVSSLNFADETWLKALVSIKGDLIQNWYATTPGSSVRTFVKRVIQQITVALGARALHGLRLLPTATALDTFLCDGDTKSFLIPSPEERALFPFAGERFLIPLREDLLEQLLGDEAGLNVRRVLPTDVGQIIEYAFPAAKGFVHVSRLNLAQVPDRWLCTLRDYITAKRVPLDPLMQLPLIPLSHPKDCYISAISSRDAFAILRPFELNLQLPTTSEPREPTLGQVITQLRGFHIISGWSDLPKDLLPQPDGFNIPLFSRWLQKQPDMMQSWWSLVPTSQNILARELLRLMGFSNVALDSSSPLARLPIWKCISQNGSTVLRFARELVVIPSFLDSYISSTRYLSQSSLYISLTGEHRQIVKALGAKVLETPNDLIPFLLLPRVLRTTDIRPFYIFLRLLLQQTDVFRHLSIVPDRQLRLHPATDLFDPDIEVFRIALYPEQLLHNDFQDMASELHKWGLRANFLDFANIEECAKAVDRAVDDSNISNVVERAATVYTALSRVADLPVREYERLGHLAFIPKRNDDLDRSWRRRYRPHLNEVVAPSQLLLKQHTPVAWTQRAGFETEPSPALSTQWSTLGLPHVREVVQHLLVLVTVAVDVEHTYGWNNAFIGDLRASYDYLQGQQADAVRKIFSEYPRVPIFLNIEDSQEHPWIWAPPEDLVLDVEYDITENGRSYTRSFLNPYRELLIIVGATRIIPFKLEARELGGDNNLESYPKRLVNGFSELLKDESLTDAILKATGLKGSESLGEIPVHRVVLAATSPFFRTLFGGGFKESETQELQISFMTMKAIVDYFYGRDPAPQIVPTASRDGDAVDVEVETLLGILLAADAYTLPELKTIIERKLLHGQLIRITTAPLILQESQTAKSEVLIDACNKFMENNAEYFDTGTR